MVVITIVRIFIMMVWIIYNIGIFAISGFSNDPVNLLNSSFFYILNLVFLAVWLFLPRMAFAMIKLKMKAGSNR
jgi:fumarate reductase subunit D